MSLMGSQKLGSCKMIFEMDQSQLPLRLTDLRRQCGQGGGRYLPLRKFAVESAFMLDQFFTDRHRFRLHRFIKLLNALALRLVELKLIREFEHMQRAWVTVQHARKCQSHTTPGPKVGYLLIA